MVRNVQKIQYLINQYMNAYLIFMLLQFFYFIQSANFFDEGTELVDSVHFLPVFQHVRVKVDHGREQRGVRAVEQTRHRRKRVVLQQILYVCSCSSRRHIGNDVCCFLKF